MIDDFKSLIGKNIVAVRGMRSTDKRKKKVPLEYLLLDDGLTFLQFDEQDPYSYHDCSPSARNISVRKDEQLWEEIRHNESIYADSTEDFYYTPY